MRSLALQRLYWAVRLDCDRGAFSGQKYWQHIAQQADHEISEVTADELVKLDAMSWANPNHELVACILEIKASGIRVSVLSNTPREIKQHLLAALDWFSVFDDLTFSCDLGITKPDPAVFEHSLRKLNVRADEAIFIDDHEANVKGATAPGIQSLLYTSNEQLAAALRKFGCELRTPGSNQR